ncbi:deaminase domain-containing protein [Micromonospora sp. NPDC049102]
MKPESSGTVDLYSERIVCDSCKSLIGQFESMFPNVRVNISTGVG